MAEQSDPLRRLTLEDMELDELGRVVVANESAARAIRAAVADGGENAKPKNANCYGCNKVRGCGGTPQVVEA